ncbi:MAG: hypothetical protein FJY81_03090 [Candidatus Aminicenantes bacterium]|nr:hypothetical protein [Candidatus Aminicenantes bacterium]
MFRCKACQFFIRLVPLRAGKNLFLRHHVDRCPICQEKLAGQAEARAVLWQPEETGNLEGIWRSCENRLEREEIVARTATPSAVSIWRRKRAVFAGIFVLLIVSAYLVFHDGQHPGSISRPQTGENGERFSITHLKIGDEPAHPIIYQPFGSELIFIWAESHENRKNYPNKEEYP